MIGAKRFRKGAVALGAILALGGGLFTGLGPGASLASSHREAPLTAADPQIDGTDLYAFVSPDDSSRVTLISNWIPFEEPAGGPNFYWFAPGVRYDINVDNNGDTKPDVIYRWVFANHRVSAGTYHNRTSFLYNNGVVNSLTDPNLLFYQTYKLTEIDHGTSTTLLNNKRVAPDDVGDASMPEYKDQLWDPAVHPIEGGQGQTFAGPVDDPFFLDLRVFDLAYGGDFSETGRDTLTGFNVHTTAIQVPKEDLARGGKPSKHPIIGIWTTAERRTLRIRGGKVTHPFVQVSRLGNPLVNEVVIPAKLKDRFNASQPSGDGQFLPFVNDPELPVVIHQLYGLDVPDSDSGTAGIQRADLVCVFLTGIGTGGPCSGLGLPALNQPPNVVPSEELRLNMSVDPCTSSCSTLGVVGGDAAGFPNGRRLSDDIIDASLDVVEGVLLGQNTPTSTMLGDGVDNNDVGFGGSFPYMAPPHSGSVAIPHA